MLPPFVLSEGFLYRICALQYTLQPFSAQSMEYFRESDYEANGVHLVRVYRSGGKRHKQTASDALVFIINATMSLPRSEFQ